MRDLILAAFWIGALPLVFVNSAAGPVFWLWDAIMSPTELMYGFMAEMPTNKIIAGTTIVLLIFGRVKDIFLSKTLVCLVLLAILASLSYFQALSEYPGDFDLYLKLIKEIVFVFSFCWLVTDRRWLEIAIFALVIAISFLGVKEGLISILTAGGHIIVGSRALGDNNQLAAALVITLPLLYHLMQNAQLRFLRISLLIVMILNVVTIIMTFSRGGFVGLVVVGLLLVKESRHKLRTIAIAIAFGIGILAFAPQAWFSRVDTIQTADDDGSFMGRVSAWKISWLIARDNPFVGGGPHAVQHWPVWGRYLADWHDLDFIPTPYPRLQPRAAHSIYFEALGDLGFTGLALYALIFAFALNSCKRVKLNSRYLAEGLWSFDLANNLRISLIAYLVTGALLSIAYQELLFVLIAFTTRLARTNSLSIANELNSATSIRKLAERSSAKPPARLNGSINA